MPITIDRTRAAQRAVRPHIHHTPLWHSTTLSEMTGTDLWLKAENLQKTGSFKPRGVLNAVLALQPQQRERGIMTFSAGNTGQAVAFAGRMLGIAATVVMPETAPQAKVDAIVGYGAEPVLVPAAELIETADELRRERGVALIHPFENEDLIAGHGTVGLEILEDLPDAEVLVISVGGGALIAGMAAAVKAVRPDIRVVGVEPERADVVTRSLAAGHPVRLAPSSIADGLNAPTTSEVAVGIVRDRVDDLITIDEEAIARATVLVVQRTKLLVEPSGAAGIAALLQGAVPGAAGKRVVALLSGGNVDIGRLAEWMA